jgi:hypothetical protein
VIALALIVVSVSIILPCAVDGCAIATETLPEEEVRHSSSDVSEEVSSGGWLCDRVIPSIIENNQKDGPVNVKEESIGFN